MSETNGSTRDSLLEAAVILFSSKGYDAVGIREIADLAGVNLASIKYHFGSKSALYQQTVCHVMANSDVAVKWNLLRNLPSDRRRAAAVLVRFVHLFLTRCLASGDPDPVGNLMIRESLEPTAAFDAVLTDVLEPQQVLLENLCSVLAPDRDEAETRLTAQSLLGQILHYRVFRSFHERLRGSNLAEPREIETLTAHIARFTLRALDFDEQAIRDSLEAGLESSPESGIPRNCKEPVT